VKGPIPGLIVGFLLGYYGVPWALRFIGERR
jgi:hypothetical protein